MLTKKQQTKHIRIKPKPERDKEYLEWFATMMFPCFVCGTYHDVKGHHIKLHSSDPKNDHELLPLCNEHHVGLMLSPHGTPKQWRETYSMDTQLEHAAEIYAEYMFSGEWME